MQAPYDLVAHTVLFSRSLREQGLLVGPSDTTDSIRSLGMVDLMDREQVYWAFRTILVSRVGEIAAFDHCFRQFWDFRRPQGRQPSLPGPAMDGVMRSFSHGSATVADDGRPGETQPPLAQIVRTGASPVEVLARRDLTEFKGDQLEKVSKIAAQIIRALPTRPGRRRRRHRRERPTGPQGGAATEPLPRRRPHHPAAAPPGTKDPDPPAPARRKRLHGPLRRDAAPAGVRPRPASGAGRDFRLQHLSHPCHPAAEGPVIFLRPQTGRGPGAALVGRDPNWALLGSA